MQRNKQQKFEDLMQYLFHGTRDVNPKLIYESKIGFDFRLSNEKGLYGSGTYFAKNSGYSNAYRYKIPDKEQYQMFVALVLTGESIKLEQTKLKAPPFKSGSTQERYDSVNNGEGGHFIVYDHFRAYPGYLITYKYYKTKRTK
eukprot:403345369